MKIKVFIILKYFLEVASCRDFRTSDPLCSYWSENIGTSHSSILQQPSGGEFSYPITFNVPYDLHPGFFYYYRIQPWNDIGAAVQIQEVEAQYGTLLYDSPFVQFPVQFPLAIAVTPIGIQIWQQASVSASIDTTILQVIGFPLVRALSEDLEISFSTDGPNILPYTTISETLQILSSSLDGGSTFTFNPPMLSASAVSECGS